ncbi:hypothetical protein CCC_02057 [Paramagnetospirillum magnetotacticum MS-1]|uniref:Uncharacterized protein n=1 Tax=Paramagnetospirillum magnetotacticum MS-1 TaxID=272627 RepID=A0A0C2UAX0_PARME|nr:hypothetical protein [Paramagnetospirillum magnetotacticum]KIL98607.1 hypothetical protein CCC_02057 [Paramagnetospirillum magnetotacticum MS-1]
MSASKGNVWARLAQSLKTLWDDDKPAPATAVAGKVPRPTARSTVESAAEWLEQMLARNPEIKAKLHVVSLSEYRDSVGEKWPRLADKVAIIVDQVVRRNIGRGNTFCRDGEDCWILAFPEVSPDEARRRTISVVEELGRFLYGHQQGAEDRPVAVAAEISVAEAVGEDGEFNVTRINRAVAEVRAYVSTSGLPYLPCAPAPAGPGVNDPLKGWASLDRRAEVRRDDMKWETIEGTGVKKPAAYLDPSIVGPIPPGASLSLLWRPTWVAMGESISAYGARVVRRDRENDEPIEGCRAYPEGDVATALALDRFVVNSAVRDIRNAARIAPEGVPQPSVILPLSWQSLASDQRNSVIFALSDLTQETRNTRLVIEIFHIPDGTTTPELESVVSFASTLCREVLVRTRLSAARTSVAAEIGVSMVGLDLSEFRPEDKMSDEQLLAVLERIQQETAKDGIGCYLWSARHRKIVGGVVQGGFEMVNGPGLMKDIPRPAMVLPAPRTRFAAE